MHSSTEEFNQVRQVFPLLIVQKSCQSVTSTVKTP
ncbi:hypothetical protein E2C01_077114 [Portunus trituberculatus]|uniref:Uncharacterized protein n=1 Tax=Portunus trituberculatus TaxID=210409 RepID=A0A5B7IKX4_PORTR|nr:hypothetical protein [Portunus trituberculatus]